MFIKFLNKKEIVEKKEDKFEKEDFILNFKPFEESLNEEEQEIDFEEQLNKNKEEMESLKAERKSLWDELNKYEIDWSLPYDQRKEQEKIHDEKSDEIRPRIQAIGKRLRELENLNKELERKIAFKNSTKSNELADEEDWEECLNRLPIDYEFTDLDIRVHDEGDMGPFPGTHSWDAVFKSYSIDGTLNDYDMEIEPTKELVAEYLNKSIEEITRKDLLLIIEDDYYEFVYDKFFEEAQKEAEEAWDNGDIDSDKVDWDEYDNEPDPDYLYDLYHDR